MPKPRLFLVPVLGLAAVTGSVGAVGMAGLTLGGRRDFALLWPNSLDLRTLLREFASA